MLIEVSGITLYRNDVSVASESLFHMQANGINQANLVARVGQPFGVDARPPSDIKDLERSRREVAQDQLLSPGQLERTRGELPRQSISFLASLVVLPNIAIERRHPEIIADVDRADDRRCSASQRRTVSCATSHRPRACPALPRGSPGDPCPPPDSWALRYDWDK